MPDPAHESFHTALRALHHRALPALRPSCISQHEIHPRAKYQDARAAMKTEIFLIRGRPAPTTCSLSSSRGQSQSKALPRIPFARNVVKRSEVSRPEQEDDAKKGGADSMRLRTFNAPRHEPRNADDPRYAWQRRRHHRKHPPRRERQRRCRSPPQAEQADA